MVGKSPLGPGKGPKKVFENLIFGKRIGKCVLRGAVVTIGIYGCAMLVERSCESTASSIEKWSQERNKRDWTPTALRDGRNDTDPDAQPLQHPPDPDWSPCR